MEIFVVSPNSTKLFTKNLKNRLESIGNVHYLEEIQSLDKFSNLFEGSGERILAVDPDFNDWKISNEDIDAIPNLKAIVLQTTSFSWIDVEHCKSKNIPVINLRGFSTEAVAEYTLTMAMAISRRLPEVIRSGWKQDYSLQGIELKDKLLGVVGIGRIGIRVAEIFSGIGMKVQYWSKNSTNASFQKVSLEQLMATSDLIIPAVAQNEETKSLISDDHIRSMKSSSMFVSVVHHIYNHNLLLELVQAGKIFGYAFEEDGGQTFSNYQGNVLAVPSLAWCTTDSFRKNAEQWVEAIEFTAQEIFTNQVNK